MGPPAITYAVLARTYSLANAVAALAACLRVCLEEVPFADEGSDTFFFATAFFATVGVDEDFPVFTGRPTPFATLTGEAFLADLGAMPLVLDTADFPAF